MSSVSVHKKGSGDNCLRRSWLSIRALIGTTQRTVRYEVTFVKRENVIVKTKQSLS